ncbi:class I SAM-dependent methyltransferase [Candidatus Pacearchaeota archaeon]|nr:class I SAM-dependent methyltransferase [Candidatus Pacearchaeota archaeon]
MEKLLDKNKKFFNKIARYYDNKIFLKYLTNSQNKMLDFIKIKENSKILDAGCGTGNLLHLLEKQNKKYNLSGIDISEEMLKIAKKKLINVKLKLQSTENIYFKESFDYVFSTEAFHHYSDYNLIMENFNKILKKDGKLIVLDFDFGFLLNKIFHSIEPGNSKMHSPEEFKRLFKQYRFKNVMQKRINLFLLLTIGKK